MSVTGNMYIGGTQLHGRGKEFRAIDPSSGAALDPPFGAGDLDDVNRACALAWRAFDIYRETSAESRARFLEAIGRSILDLGDELVERAMAECGLPRLRIESERARTVDQLRLFADVVRDGGWVEARLDPALPDRKPNGRPDLRQRHIAIGPVAVFGASNFPLAFSVAGGDTASALAAGCPVVVKAHSSHPGTSELVGQAIVSAAKECGMPDGVFSMLFGSGATIGAALVADPRTKAVGFTGSRRAGMSLMSVAFERPEPIPVYAEMSSINPVFVLPHALAARADALATSFVSSLSTGVGQLCTNPGLLFAVDGPDLERFLSSAREAISATPAATMLTPGIHMAYVEGLEMLGSRKHVQTIARGRPCSGPHQCQTALFATDADAFQDDHSLHDEVFGASSLVVRCPDTATMNRIAEGLEGQLTATVQMDRTDLETARVLLPVLERKAGRILFNGWPTGVEVCHAMVHGGPFPATSDSRVTSVGSLSIRRFLRPVCYQNCPPELLPAAVSDRDPLKLWGRLGG
jgi:2,5-dioxopentanoate dehydrogenase